MAIAPADLALLESIERRVLWLSTLMVHHANQVRPNPDGTKVGGHQASSSSVVSLLTALYFHALDQGDVVAVKAHGSPAFYAIEYLRGRLDREALEGLRTFGGLQAYPSRRKNPEVVDLSTGSMGLGAVMAAFSALATRYLADHGGVAHPRRFVAMLGDAELDEGNVWEALLEDSLAELGNLLWIVDMNRQSLDRVVPDARRGQLRSWFAAAGWHVIELRWGSRLHATFARPGGERLRARLEAMSNAEYHALIRSPAGAVRKALVTARDGDPDVALDRFLADSSDEALQALVGDVGGHDLVAITEAYAEAERHRAGPSVILADTIKGWGLPLAGDQMNHGALLTQTQLHELRDRLGIASGDEWAGFPAGSAEAALIARAPVFAPPAAPAASPDVRRSPRRVVSAAELEPGGLWPRAGQARPPARRRSHRHALRRRGGDHAPRGVDQSQGRLRSARQARWPSRARRRPSCGRNRRPASTSSWASRSTTCSWPWAPSASRANCPARRSCPSARSTIRSSRAASTRSTTRCTRAPGSSWRRRRRA